MKVLFSVSHFGFLRNFEHGLRELARRGHRIHLLADRRENLGGMRTIENLQHDSPDAFSWSFSPSPKAHVWHLLGISLRQCLDYWRYLDRRYDQAPALRRRAAGQVPPIAVAIPSWPVIGSRAVMSVLSRLVRVLERAVPPGPHVAQVLEEHQPDLLVVTPLLYFGSPQVDYVRGARVAGVPAMLCVGSWDHLTTKGLIHEVPDAVTVWNEAQRDEALALHGVPREIVRATGAHAYDHWFDYTPSLTRDAFMSMVGLPADRQMLLYLCSSPFIAPYEVGLVRQWIEGIRAHADPALRNAALLVRPHPQNAAQWKDVDLSTLGAAIWPRAGSNPVDQAARADYYHSMYFSEAVVGVNTSALIESGIVGRPVFSVRSEQFSGTQEGTLHFQHLKNVNGGLLSVADTLDHHYRQLVELLAAPEPHRARGRAFVEGFIRPHGIDTPAAPIFADAVEAAAELRQPPVEPSLGRRALRRLLYPLAAAVHRARRKKPAPKIEGEVTTPDRLRALMVMQSPEYLRFFDGTLLEMAERGHRVLVAVNALRDPAKKQSSFGGLGAGGQVTFVGVIPQRHGLWAPLARGVRGTMDFVRYLAESFADTPALRQRIKRKVLPWSMQWLDRARSRPQATIARWLAWLAAVERAIPVDHHIREFIAAHKPDVVLVSPLVDAASEQVDAVRAARALGIPVGVCVASWDNLTNKGLLRVQPDFITVWNELQRTEAVELHGMPADIVTVTGAQAFDRWFVRAPSQPREAFCAMLGFDSAKPIVLFTGSSFFISGHAGEVPFVQRWIAAIRGGSSGQLRDANILIRPHPYNADQWASADLGDFDRVSVWPRGRHNPTDEQNRNLFFDSLFHSAAVVGVNTSAMVEAAILGKPVHAIMGGDFAATQEGTIHFRYLLPENGGFLQVASTLEAHVTLLAASLADVQGVQARTRQFVGSFLRPRGLDQPCVPLLVSAIEERTAAATRMPESASIGSLALRAILAPAMIGYAAFTWTSHAIGSVEERRKSARLLNHRLQKGVKTFPRRVAWLGSTAHRRIRKRGRRTAQLTWILGKRGRRAAQLTWILGRRVLGWPFKSGLRLLRHVRYHVAVRLRGADAER